MGKMKKEARYDAEDYVMIEDKGMRSTTRRKTKYERRVSGSRRGGGCGRGGIDPGVLILPFL